MDDESKKLIEDCINESLAESRKDFDERVSKLYEDAGLLSSFHGKKTPEQVKQLLAIMSASDDTIIRAFSETLLKLKKKGFFSS